jgi:hypothetical protein
MDDVQDNEKTAAYEDVTFGNLYRDVFGLL